jgi:hypothetical protein
MFEKLQVPVTPLASSAVLPVVDDGGLKLTVDADEATAVEGIVGRCLGGFSFDRSPSADDGVGR